MKLNVSIWKRANFNTKMNIENSFKIYGLDRWIQVTLSCIVNKKLHNIRDIYIYTKKFIHVKISINSRENPVACRKRIMLRFKLTWAVASLYTKPYQTILVNGNCAPTTHRPHHQRAKNHPLLLKLCKNIGSDFCSLFFFFPKQ